MNTQVKCVKKLIEVTLPLDKINEECEKQSSNPFLKGHPRSLHIWWARRPLAAARAVIFSQMVNDPAGRWELENPGAIPSQQLRGSWTKKRNQLFNIIEDLVRWENTTNEKVLDRARNEIKKSWREVCDLNKDHPQASELFNPDKLPAFHDPFAGGGAIPLEAQRLGFEAYASDLNPVAVLINKAMIEIPPKFAGQPPIGPIPKGETALAFNGEWKGATGLAEDVRRYGVWMRNEAQKRIGHLFPKIEITKKMAASRPDLDPMVGEKLTVIAWLWARTVKSPNPAFHHVDVPLVSTFILSNKAGKEAYVDPIITGDKYHFEVKLGEPAESLYKGTTAGKRNGFRCLLSDSPIPYDYIRDEGISGRLSTKLLAIVAEGQRGRVYLSPNEGDVTIANSAKPVWRPDLAINYQPRDIRTQIYGLMTYGDLFTHRQLVSLTTFSDLISEVIEKVQRDALGRGLYEDVRGLDIGGTGVFAYAQAIGVYLGLAVSKWTDLNNAICTWNSTNANISHLFSKQAIPMSWDFVELSAFSPVAGFESVLQSIADLSPSLPAKMNGVAKLIDAQTQTISQNKMISTDPPYYDNIGYADLSDFFYVWLRKSLKIVFPSLFSTLAVPKAEELVATPYRHGTKEKAEDFFLTGMTAAMHSLAMQAHPEIPITIYYARKQSAKNESEAITGWELFLESAISAGFQITGTWPMRTEREARSIGQGTNALASSIILVCRRRPDDAPTVSRREFIRELNIVLPDALDGMVHGTDSGISPIAPVDLSQAIIGSGMAVFSRYSAVLESDGSKMSVRKALQLINRYFLANDLDAETQWCLKWFEQNGWKEGAFGQADDLSRAMGTSVGGIAESGVIESGGGRVRLLRPSEYPTEWNPKPKDRIPIWETLHHLIRSLGKDGAKKTGRLLGAVKGQTEGVRILAFRLYTFCERAGWAEDARTYNDLMTSWTSVAEAAGEVITIDSQGELF
jgi:putative DNA methylase